MKDIRVTDRCQELDSVVIVPHPSAAIRTNCSKIWAGGFSLFIAGLGLFGLTAIAVVRRTKGTGIRKVLGAGVADILILFSRDILRWVVAATFLS
jgi:hypothetical protein